MKKELSFGGWDFDNVWRIEEGFNYPLLREFSTGDLNRDRKVNFLDFQIFADNWLAGTQ